jgi:hypothetical protein
MARAGTIKKTTVAGVIAVSSLGFGGCGASAQTEIPEMIIDIYNNSTTVNVYPVMSFPGQTPDEWLQAFFKVPETEINTKTYPSASTTRMYVNCCARGENGIPPGGSVRIKLPLYSPLVDSIDPTKPGQLIEWWQGGNINLYQGPQAKGPPLALKKLWDDSTQQPVEITSGPPKCVGSATCHIFSAATGNPVPHDPQQLVEFTLGAAPVNKQAKRGDPHFLFDPQNVDYDVSYVNSAYLPVVMEPFGNKLVGYVGAPTSIPQFKKAVNKFLDAEGLGKDWPLYLDNDGHVVPGKVPSVLEILAASIVNDPALPNDGDWVNPPKFSPSPATSLPIQNLIDRWRTCQKGADAPICKGINEATELLRVNFQNYIDNYSNNAQTGWGCDQTKKPHPPSKRNFTDLQLLQHLYGWVQFNEHCAADANLLQHTPGYKNPDREPNYQKVKNEFDKLQYWKDVLEGDYGVFHPYVALIHGPTFIDAPYTYAYSVDDAVGNMQTDGRGLIIAVGGTQNLPNPDHATPNVNFNFAYKSLSNGNFFTKFGRCKPAPDQATNPNFSSFAVPVGVTKKVSDCLITFEDNLERQYQFQIGDDYPPDSWPWFYKGINEQDPKAHAPLAASCVKNKPFIRREWCDYLFAFRQRLDDARGTIEYHVQIREPPPAR